MGVYQSTRQLFNLVTRQAIVIEQVKLGETQLLNQTLREVEKELRRIMASVKFENMGELNKTQLAALLKAIRKSQVTIYSRYQNDLISRLEQFMKATVKQSVVINATVYDGYDSIKARSEYESQQQKKKQNEDDSIIQPLDELEPLSYPKALTVVEKAMKEQDNSSLFGFIVLGGTITGFNFLWSKIKNSPMPSGGALPIDYIQVGLADAMVNVENAVRNGFANKSTVAEVLAALFGSKGAPSPGDNVPGQAVPAGERGVIQRTSTTMGSVLNTVMQHVSQQAQAAAASAVYPDYVWVSVIDQVTSSICRERNRKSYRYGEGPLPPAHNNCRSHIQPFAYYDPDFKQPSFLEWLKAQPKSFISSIYGVTIANKIADGSITVEEMNKFRPSVAMSVGEFSQATSDLFQI